MTGNILKKYGVERYIENNSYFLKDFMYLFLERREGRDEERKRNSVS